MTSYADKNLTCRDCGTNFTFTVGEDELDRSLELTRAIAADLGARDLVSTGGMGKLSIVGTGMLGTPGIAARMFRTLAGEGINIEMISPSEIRITCLVDSARLEDGVRALHASFELDREVEA